MISEAVFRISVCSLLRLLDVKMLIKSYDNTIWIYFATQNNAMTHFSESLVIKTQIRLTDKNESRDKYQSVKSTFVFSG